MSEPNDRDREVAQAFNIEHAQKGGWPVLVVSAYREECVKAEREQWIAALQKLAAEWRETEALFGTNGNDAANMVDKLIADRAARKPSR